VGYVISTQGFQTGAFDASELTNLHLVTWEEFQKAFEESWLENHFIERITKDLDPLLSYAEPLLPEWFDLLPDGEQNAFVTLKETYDVLGAVAMSMTRYMRLGGRPLPTLPLSAQVRPDVAARL